MKTTIRKIAARTVLDAACGPLAPVAEAAAEEIARRVLKPRIDGNPVESGLPMQIGDNVTFAKLRIEDFERYEEKAMQDVLAGREFLDCAPWLTSGHILDVSGKSHDWAYEHIGWTIPEHKMPDSRFIRDIPDPAMRALAQETYYEPIVTGEPTYSFVRQGPNAYRRLIVPVFGPDHTRVVRLHIAIVMESYNSVERLIARSR